MTTNYQPRTVPVERDRLRRAYRAAREDLLGRRTAAGHWTGELSSSALSTATAVSALALLLLHQPTAEQPRLRALIDHGLDWIYQRQNHDGGWGDTDRSVSNISTTMLVRAATHLAGQQQARAEALARGEQYIESQGGIAGLRRRYGRDKTFAVPILTNYALAGLVSWREVSPLPFEAACLPQSWYRFAQLPVVSYAIPALVAIGQARYFKQPPLNPIARIVRKLSIGRSMKVLQRMQPASGGYLEATPLTSFVVMSLAGTGRHDHPVTRLGLQFLLDSVRPDGSWPIDTNLATWVSTLSVNALGVDEPEHLTPTLLAWLLSCQHRERHPFTGASPGGWGWSDLSGAVPDADDTPGALLAIATWLRGASDELPTPRVLELYGQVRGAVEQGLDWLLGLQNSDGGWPTFCRGWGILPFDRSGTDLAAHALRALHVWQEAWGEGCNLKQRARMTRATEAGLRYLERQQRPDGSWLPLWFGNQARPDDENPLYGTARVLFAYRDLRLLDTEPAIRAAIYLESQQNGDGGWGCGPAQFGMSATNFTTSSVEETALVVEALLAFEPVGNSQSIVTKGLNWLLAAVERGEHREPSPIGFYFAKLWYYESLYPIIFTVSALGRALSAFEAKERP